MCRAVALPATSTVRATLDRSCVRYCTFQAKENIRELIIGEEYAKFGYPTSDFR